jgi:hypothetical protein
VLFGGCSSGRFVFGGVPQKNSAALTQGRAHGVVLDLKAGASVARASEATTSCITFINCVGDSNGLVLSEPQLLYFQDENL